MMQAARKKYFEEKKINIDEKNYPNEGWNKKI